MLSLEYFLEQYHEPIDSDILEFCKKPCAYSFSFSFHSKKTIRGKTTITLVMLMICVQDS